MRAWYANAASIERDPERYQRSHRAAGGRLWQILCSFEFANVITSPTPEPPKQRPPPGDAPDVVAVNRIELLTCGPEDGCQSFCDWPKSCQDGSCTYVVCEGKGWPE